MMLEEVDSANETALALRGFQHDCNRPIGARKALIGKNAVKWTCLPKSVEFAAETVCDRLSCCRLSLLRSVVSFCCRGSLCQQEQVEASE